MVLVFIPYPLPRPSMGPPIWRDGMGKVPGGEKLDAVKVGGRRGGGSSAISFLWSDIDLVTRILVQLIIPLCSLVSCLYFFFFYNPSCAVSTIGPGPQLVAKSIYPSSDDGFGGLRGQVQMDHQSILCGSRRYYRLRVHAKRYCHDLA